VLISSVQAFQISTALIAASFGVTGNPSAVPVYFAHDRRPA